jgi:transcriptional regulator with PAS, ATPase and Fis domain
VNPVITKSLEKIYRDAEIAATSKEPVLILGETGVGKEVLARYIHSRSPRSAQPFLPLNCSALPPALIESELFGHARGAFTGAVTEKKGMLEQARQGTMLLDELGDMPLDTQAKLLRVIETGEVWPVGSQAYRQIDVRFIAATNADLKSRIELGQFRRDLYYRLNMFVYYVRPLRERPEDIVVFAESLLDGKMVLSPSVLELFRCYPWPGNLRELRNVITYVRCRATGREVLLEHLPPELVDTCKYPAILNCPSLKVKLECFEAEVLRQALKVDPNPQVAAERIGIELRTLYRRMRKFGIRVPPRRDS